MSPLEQTLRAAFAGVNARDPEAVLACWNPDGVYDNPSVAPARHGIDAMRPAMVDLCDGVRARGQQLVIDRMTVGDRLAIAEWHVEPATGARGVHVADFDAADKLVRVTVYPRS